MSDAPAGHWYTLDRYDVIRSVGDHWDDGADGYPLASASGVVGRNLFDCICGVSTRLFMESVLQAVRLTAAPRTLLYRCDAPNRIRRLRMVLTPGPDEAVTVEHFLVSEQARPTLPALRLRERDDGSAVVKRCSQCQLFLWPASTAWTEGRATDTGFAKALDQQTSLEIVDVVCPPCQEGLPQRSTSANASASATTGKRRISGSSRSG
jgi:hypothetical protein